MAFATVKLFAGPDAVFIGGTGEMGADWIVFQLSDVSADFFSVPHGLMDGVEVAPMPFCYYDFLADHKVAIAAGTPITRAGVFGVFAPEMSLYMLTAQGTASLNWKVPR